MERDWVGVEGDGIGVDGLGVWLGLGLVELGLGLVLGVDGDVLGVAVWCGVEGDAGTSCDGIEDVWQVAVCLVRYSWRRY